MKKLILLACVTAIACGDDDLPVFDGGPADTGTMPDVIVLDSGMTPDTSPAPDVGPGLTICSESALEVVEATLGEIVTTTIDTSAATATPETLSEGCGNELTGQIVVAVTVPGDAMVGVRFSTDNPGTDEIDTILETRTDCGDVTTATCFDDIDFPDNPYSQGGLSAMGGDTVYAVISGYGADDQGTVEVSVEVAPNAAPVLDSSEISYFVINDEDATLIVNAAGSDAEGNVVSYKLFFVDSEGNDVDFTDDGVADSIILPWTDDLTGMTEFAATNTEEWFNMDDVADITQARITVLDSFGAESNPLVVDLFTGVGMGEACDEETRCSGEFTCFGDVCVDPVAPTLTAATGVYYVDADGVSGIAVEMTGGDVHSDVDAWTLSIINAAGDILEIGEMPMPATFSLGFPEAEGLETFTEVAVGFADFDWPADATGVRVNLVDRFGLTSDTIDVTYTTGTFVPADGACGGTLLCEPALECNDSDVCATPAM